MRERSGVTAWYRKLSDSVSVRAIAERKIKRLIPKPGFDQEADMDWMPYITTDASVLHGAVRFTGTRIPVTVVLDNLADGATAAAILAQYPSLRSEHVAAALAYAADLARERLVPIPA